MLLCIAGNRKLDEGADVVQAHILTYECMWPKKCKAEQARFGYRPFPHAEETPFARKRMGRRPRQVSFVEDPKEVEEGPSGRSERASNEEAELGSRKRQRAMLSSIVYIYSRSAGHEAR